MEPILTEQKKLEKVIKELGRVSNDIVDGYITEPDMACNTINDAIDLLKAREPRLLTFEDFDNNPEVDSKGRLPAWVEHNWKGGPSLTDDGYAAVTKQEMENWDRSFIRWWTSRPNKAQMEAIPWE